MAAFAAAPTQWRPGRAVGYHTLSYGHLLGEVVRRATGRTIAHHLREISDPMGVAFHLGLPDGTDDIDCADFVPASLDAPSAALAHAGDHTDFAALSNFALGWQLPTMTVRVGINGFGRIGRSYRPGVAPSRPAALVIPVHGDRSAGPIPSSVSASGTR